MKRPNYQNEILNIFNSRPKGTIFIYQDFIDIADLNTLRKTIKRLVDSKQVTRVFDGMFSILEFSSLLNKEVYPSAIQIAKTIARKFKWDIFPTGNTALNIVGLSTQVPNKYDFLSNGPYRSYNYLNSTISFKNTVNRKLNIGSDNIITLVTAIDYLGLDNIRDREINIIKDYIITNIEYDELVKDTKTLPVWIYNLLKQIYKELKTND